MGQYWTIVNLDCRHKYELAKLGESFFDGWEWLTRVLTDPLIPAPPAVTAQVADSLRSSLGALALPVEIVLKIFDELEDLEDAEYLSIAHPTLEAIGATRVHALRLAENAPWIGGRLVCIGNYAQLNDLPVGMLSSTERAEIKRVCRGGDAGDESDSDDESDSSNDSDVSRDSSNNSDVSRNSSNNSDVSRDSSNNSDVSRDSSNDIVEPTLYNFAERAYTDFAHYLSELNSPFGRSSKDIFGTHGSDFTRYLAMRHAAYDGDDWILCNLSKQEFVLSRTIKDFTGEKTKGPLRKGRIGFGMAILARICWSSSSSIAMLGPENLHSRGSLPGDNSGEIRGNGKHGRVDGRWSKGHCRYRRDMAI
ncbi:hypothetical protein FA95DRAFT_1227471 [Auriscalpium vulgare]|uniref:Uncharacterized protein n=1 Tax=Auriscalpium vulgare TaxID=40419 RepID=A0ACB8RUW9_9AGAM|nr:hypothetical protein FA95DRAFT_1227471 [Auriscalpium vulgare]